MNSKGISSFLCADEMPVNGPQMVNVDREFEGFCDLYMDRENILVLIIQLNQLLKCVQRHRGMSLGMLSGDANFSEGFSSLQVELERRLATIEMFAKKMNGLISDKGKESLHLAWSTVGHNWQDDNLDDNFELHSHFVQQLLAMIYDLAKRLQQPLAPNGLVQSEREPEGEFSGAFSQPRLFKQIEILNFVGKHLLEMIENVAKIRGLASYAAAVGSASALDIRKLRFLLSSTRSMHEKILKLSERLALSLSGEMSQIPSIKSVELKLLFLLNAVEGDVLSDGPIAAEPQKLFGLATDIINIYWDVVNEGFSLVRLWHNNDLDAWCRLKS